MNTCIMKRMPILAADSIDSDAATRATDSRPGTGTRIIGTRVNWGCVLGALMELTRRDAVAALAAIGVGGGALYGARELRDGRGRGASGETPTSADDTPEERESAPATPAPSATASEGTPGERRS